MKGVPISRWPILHWPISLWTGALRSGGITALAAFSIFSLGAWAFLELASAVVAGNTLGADRAILLALRDPADPARPLGPTWLQEMMRDFTAMGGVAVLGLIATMLVLYFAMARRYRSVLFVLGTIGGALVLSSLLKLGFDRPRPDLVPYGSHVYTASFPSGHSLLSATTYLTCGVLFARLHSRWRMRAFAMVMAVLLTFWVGVSRIYLGVHWPSDVLAGWSVGAAWTALCVYVALHWRGRRDA